MIQGPTLRQGSIVWATAISPRGEVKDRPMIVLNRSSEIFMDLPLVCVAISTSFWDDGHRCVKLPWSRQAHSSTGLRRRSAAVCDWLVTIRPSDVKSIKGFVPTRLMLEIIRKVNVLTNPGKAYQHDRIDLDKDYT